MAMEIEQAAEPSEQMESTWILTESHEFLKNVLSHLPAKELFKCARVCKQWKKEAQNLIKVREQLGWVSYNYNTAPDGGSDHALGYFGENLEECIQSIWSVPQYVLMFTELVSRTDYTLGTRHSGHFGGYSKARFGKRQAEIQATLNIIKGQLPQHCTLLSLQTSFGTVGTYPSMELAGESEGDGGATAVFFPKMQGVNIQVLKVSRKVISGSSDKSSIQEALGIAQTTDVKCVLLFGLGNSPSAQVMATYLQECFRDTCAWDPVIAGAIADDLLTKQDLPKEEALTKVIGLTFSGPNIQAASLILGSDICTKENVKQELQRLKKIGLPEEKSIAFMFACMRRGLGFHGQKDAESTAFRELFPSTPLFGFFGNGEIGCDNFACGKANTNQEGDQCTSRLPDIIHSYTTIFCLLSFGQAT